MSGFRDRYGASPLHLLLVLTSFAVALYAGLRLLRGDTLGVLIWFVGAALVHDLFFLPVYSLTDRVVQRWCGPPAVRTGHDATPVPAVATVNHLRVPFFLSGLLLLVWWPLILRQVPHYTATTGLPADVFLGRWLLITASLLAVSAVCLLVRMRRAGRAAPPR
ncbi:hypothetical protein [Streptomyces uncialis]|uniref:hypothetical protein n=1 Tax=Streptomyces uncialis TaxID=1048205 RepID=UPI0038704AB9|nr:hypothetical protein OG268_01635 [Streptomyces uncialis]